jgi:hypothetical protein
MCGIMELGGYLVADDIDGAFESISDLQNLHDSCNFLEIRHEIGNYMGRLMSCIIELCGEARISSTQLLETVRQRFDKAALLKIVNLSDVAESYRLAEAHEWEHRLRS